MTLICAGLVRVTETEIIIYSPQVEEVARHALPPRKVTGQRSVHKEHRPSVDTQHRQAQLAERFAESGETGLFLEGLLRMQRYGKDQAQRVLALLGNYTRQDLIAALERATHYGAFYAAVERILSVQARPKTTGRRWPRKNDGTCPLGWTRIRSRPGPHRTTNPSMSRSCPTMPKPIPRPTKPPQVELRNKILEDFQCLVLPLRSDQLDGALARAESGGCPPGILTGSNRRTGRPAARAECRPSPLRGCFPGEPELWPTSIGSSMPAPLIGCRSKHWPGPSSSIAIRIWFWLGRAAWVKATSSRRSASKPVCWDIGCGTRPGLGVG